MEIKKIYKYGIIKVQPGLPDCFFCVFFHSSKILREMHRDRLLAGSI